VWKDLRRMHYIQCDDPKRPTQAVWVQGGTKRVLVMHPHSLGGDDDAEES